MSPRDLYGKVVRLHSETQPQRLKLYIITNEKHDYISNGRVTAKTVLNWIDSGLNVTIYSEESKEMIV